MKMPVIITLLLILFYFDSSPQSCLPEGMIFTSQAAIDSFPVINPGCTEIEGDVQVIGEDITNLPGFSQVTQFNGDLIIGDYWESNPLLENLSGLENVTQIAGNLIIANTELITDLSGLGGLERIGGRLSA